MTEREIFLALLEMPDPAERNRFLDEILGDQGHKRDKFNALVRSHEATGDFLETPAISFTEVHILKCLALSEDKTADLLREGEDSFPFLTPSERPDSLGRLKHYEMLEVLGRGAFGIVFRAYDISLQRVVAVKIPAPELVSLPPARKSLLSEARATARIQHENVVHMYAVEEQPLPFLVMEYVPGETLQQRLDREGPLDVEEVIHVASQIAKGLAAAHAQGMIHRDIKPANILIGAERFLVKISDFGMARNVDEASASHKGFIAGTPLYMSPEQARGEKIDSRTDLFSFGSVLYALCTGKPPFQAQGALAVLKRVAEETPQPITSIRPEVPTWLGTLITRLHAKNPAERLATAQDAVEILTEGLRKWPQQRERSSARRFPLSRRGRSWLVGAAFLVLVIVGVALTFPAYLSEATRENRPHSSQFQNQPVGKNTLEETETETETGDSGEPVLGSAALPELLPAPQATFLASDASDAWERSVAQLPAEEQVQAVASRLKILNPEYDGQIVPVITQGVVTEVSFASDHVQDLSPIRALRDLQTLTCGGQMARGKLADLSPLRGMTLRILRCHNTRVADLSPLQGMPLFELGIQSTRVSSLAPLANMSLQHLNCSHTDIKDLSPLQGMQLNTLYLDGLTQLDLAPLKKMPLIILNCRNHKWVLPKDRDLLLTLEKLETVNSNPVDPFLKRLGTKQEE